MTLGKWCVCLASTWQKSTTKNSTEAELVGVGNMMPMVVLWTGQFREGQGHNTKDNIAHQDNQSAMLLKKNRQQPSRKKRRHPNLRCFFLVTGMIPAKELTLERCRIGDIWADLFTKPLQEGAAFVKFVKQILNLDD
jgi:hypothetical protein